MKSALLRQKGHSFLPPRNASFAQEASLGQKRSIGKKHHLARKRHLANASLGEQKFQNQHVWENFGQVTLFSH